MTKIFFTFLFFVGSLASAQELSYEDVKPIFESRCIACHSCFNAPCQFNLQSFEGFLRGATSLNVYDGSRLESVEPTRMFVDAQTTHDWRQKGFFSVADEKENVLLEVLKIRRNRPQSNTTLVTDSMICPQNVKQTKSWWGSSNPQLGMPFGFPPLTDHEYVSIEKWIQQGAKNKTSTHSLDQTLRTQIKTWEDFFNRSSLPQKLVSRYLYEHLFLAHIYFPEDSQKFFRLVRSKTRCRDGIQEIATRKPNDSPQTPTFFYCFKQDTQPVVYKTHMPLQFDAKRLQNWQRLFFQSTPWTVTQLPKYTADVAQNPFIAFADIPSQIKYKFLLDEAQYHVITFIKGPVCNGTSAVNSIQEQFFVFFINPSTDPMSDPQHERQAQKLLTLPGEFGSDVKIEKIPELAKGLTDLRERYRRLRVAWYKQHKPAGLGLNDIWDGEKTNNNAVLTVFRHNDNAVVVKGAVGNLPKTSFVLDYSLFERLVYNLVVNFDVFGNVGHQYLTRVYMDFIRMESEENFLLLVSPEQRQIYRQEWYRGALTEEKMKHIFPDVSAGEPTAMKFTKNYGQKREAIEQLLSHFSDKVRGEGDSLNWRDLTPEKMKMASLSREEMELRPLVSVPSVLPLTFARYFPETAYLILRENGKIKEVYSLIHNREFTNISWIVAEDLRRDDQQDTLTLLKGYWIPYPEKIFNFEVSQIKPFVDAILAIQNEEDASKVFKNYQASAADKNFWKVWDELHYHMKNRKETQGDSGALDLTRYLRE